MATLRERNKSVFISPGYAIIRAESPIETMNSLNQILFPGIGRRSTTVLRHIALFSLGYMLSTHLSAQPYGEADRGQPADQMIQDYLRHETEKVESDFLGSIKSAGDWNQARPRFLQEYYDMLGLWPIPEKTPLRATITHTLDKGDYAVDMLHYQSRPGLYVTANLFRPAKAANGQRLPAILYVCGHSGRGRDGNKAAFQSHGIWFARHGYVCLVVDTLQLGEIAGIHHGTYREGRWWWLSRGYTPAGVECWNGVRGIDYLLSRPDVDAERIGVTGISGGGAATFWIAAADERVKVAVPVSGMADLVSYVPNRVINGHCDCMFLYNAYQWPWTRIAALVAPRPMLFVNSDRDAIFPMDANERVINRLERLYSLFGASDVVDSVVSIGGHAYRQDIRQAAFRFFNAHLKSDPRQVWDSEVDLVTGPREEIHPIPPELLRAFPQDSDIPKDALNGRIDREFVPMAKVELPKEGAFDGWKGGLLAKLRRMTFHHFPERIPAATRVNASSEARLNTEPGISVRLRTVRAPSVPAKRVFIVVANSDLDGSATGWMEGAVNEQDAVYVCEPRGIGSSRWTQKHPPNYVARSHYLLGRTVDAGRVWDIAATARYLRAKHDEKAPVHLVGAGASAVLAVYAALLEPDVAGLTLDQLPATHMDDSAPALLNVLRVCDIPEALGMLAPRPVTLVGNNAEAGQKAAAIYRAAKASDKLILKE
jgi:dienelactone hydrolase